MNETLSGIRLDDQHRYYRMSPKGDTRVPGFSEICQDLGVIKPNPFHTEGGRDEGTALAQWTIFLAKGEEPAEAPDARIAGRLEGFRKFLTDSGFSFEGGEEPVYHPSLVYCCTPDLYGSLGGARCVIDTKRGAKEPWHPLQTAAQKMALGANGIICLNRYSLYLKDGDYRLDQHKDKSDEDRWTALVTAYHAKSFHCKGSAL